MGVSRKWKTGQKFQQRGFSLLEMAAAAVLVTSILVPSLSVMRDAMAKSRDMNHRNVLSSYATYQLEIYAGQAAGNWTLAANYTNSFPIVATNGYGNIRIDISMSDDPANGGLTNRLSHLKVTAYDDVNGNTTLDANEPFVKYRTKVAKLNTYEAL